MPRRRPTYSLACWLVGSILLMMMCFLVKQSFLRAILISGRPESVVVGRHHRIPCIDHSTLSSSSDLLIARTPSAQTIQSVRIQYILNTSATNVAVYTFNYTPKICYQINVVNHHSFIVMCCIAFHIYCIHQSTNHFTCFLSRFVLVRMQC